MPFSDTTYNLRIELDTQNRELSTGEIERLEKGLEPLRRPVEKFPVSDLYITIIFQPRSRVHRVKLALVLPGRTIATGDIDSQMYPAFQRSVRKIVKKLDTYISSLEMEPERRKHQKGTHHHIILEQAPDQEALEKALDEGDFVTFRNAMLVYEEPLRQRIGRWVERYPEIENALGERWTLADMVDEVFLNAFERYDERPREIRFGEWLEHLIDPSVKLLTEHPDEELENIQFARTTRDVQEGRKTQPGV